MATGQRAYAQNCAGCHGAEGGGGAGPNLAGNPVVQSTLGTVQMIITGYLGHGMPPFGHLSDEVIAGVATYVRNSWGNAFGPVDQSAVASIRRDIQAAGPGE